MLIPVQDLLRRVLHAGSRSGPGCLPRYALDRLRQPRSRADEVLALRRRLAAEPGPGPGQVGAEERAAAIELRRLREELVEKLGAVRSCTRCAVGHPLPHGRFSGGHCCGLQTADAFNDDEVAALRQAGTRPGDLRLPDGEHAGCSFRGPTGCSLAARDRPNLCVRYLCPDLRRELHRRGDGADLEALGAALERAYLRFTDLRRARLEADEASAQEAELAALGGAG
ncbi:MAG: hypothetical protein U1A78_07460 [Polyangia bacterium]